jgi:hypothetical protein
MASTMNPAFLHIRMRNNQMRLLNILALVILVEIAGCESREEAPDDKTAMTVLLHLASLGNVHTTTVRAFTAAEMDKIVAKVHVG